MAQRYDEERLATFIENGNLGFKQYGCVDRETGLERSVAARAGFAGTSAKTMTQGTASATRWKVILPG